MKPEETAPKPSREEIIDLAITMAQEDRGEVLGTRMRELFYWPQSATPCRDHRRPYLETVEKYKKKAEEELRQHYEYHHRLTVRRKRWLKAHPKPRGWAWTRQPTLHTLPPPRRRVVRPPGALLPEAMAPPLGPAPSAPQSRPRRPEPERLLCFSWLFDNRRVVFFPGFRPGPPHFTLAEKRRPDTLQAGTSSQNAYSRGSPLP